MNTGVDRGGKALLVLWTRRLNTVVDHMVSGSDAMTAGIIGPEFHVRERPDVDFEVEDVLILGDQDKY